MKKGSGMRVDSRFRRAAVVVALLGAGTLSGCTQVENAMSSVSFLNFMREAPFFDPYESPRPAPPNSVPLSSPRGEWEPDIPTPVTEQALVAFGDTLSNPLAGDPAALERGAEVFQTYCMVCHGAQGEGNGPVVDPAAGKFPMGPDLRIATTVNRSDGYLYAIMKAGRGLMPSYRRIPPQDRWAVVSYVRQLQGQAAAPAQAAAPGQAEDEPAATAAESEGQD
ncbi:MAG TPA: cytochrome c [Longimicrobiales bacterium]|nr:cytochrome c [Longimicrobiales bacterium]